MGTATTTWGRLEWTGRGQWRVLPALGLGVAGLLATALTVWGVARSPILGDPVATAIWRGAFVGSYVAVGGYTWWRRGDSRLGPLVAGVGFVYSLASLNASGASLAYTIGMVLWAIVIVYLAYVFLCFPLGRLASELERGFVAAYAVSVALAAPTGEG